MTTINSALFSECVLSVGMKTKVIKTMMPGGKNQPDGDEKKVKMRQTCFLWWTPPLNSLRAIAEMLRRFAEEKSRQTQLNTRFPLFALLLSNAMKLAAVL